MLFALGMVGGVRMKVGDLVRHKNPVYFKGFGIVIKDSYGSPWRDCVKVCWYGMEGSNNHGALMRTFDLELAF